MDRKKLRETVFVGVVMDNMDPKRLGRVKVMVHSVYDNIPTSDLPWCRPWKDLDGNIFNMPDIGKIVSVVFDDGDVHSPEYIYADHYNINLENKLKALSDDDYKTFKSVMLDQSTQIYRSKSEGLKIDHEYSNINLDSYGNILLNLRDDKSIITFGSRDASESALLGDAFMNWFDTLVDNLLGKNAGPYLASGYPVTANPSLVDCLQQYQNLRETFLSDHVKISDNGNIIAQSRPYVNQFGDVVSTTDPNANNLTTISGSPYSPNSNYQPPGQLDANPASGTEPYDPSKYNNPQPPLPFTGTASALQRNAINISVNATLSRGQFKGKCARFTYNHAFNYLNCLKGKTPNAGAPLSAGGNAKDAGYHNMLVKLGWTQIYNATISKSSLESILLKDHGIGDVVVYYGADGTSNHYAIYGHTQMFTGGIPSISGGYKWTTDNATNYSTYFVYRSAKCDTWAVWIFKAPTS